MGVVVDWVVDWTVVVSEEGRAGSGLGFFIFLSMYPDNPFNPRS